MIKSKMLICKDIANMILPGDPLSLAVFKLDPQFCRLTKDFDPQYRYDYPFEIVYMYFSNFSMYELYKNPSLKYSIDLPRLIAEAFFHKDFQKLFYILEHQLSVDIKDEIFPYDKFQINFYIVKNIIEYIIDHKIFESKLNEDQTSIYKKLCNNLRELNTRIEWHSILYFTFKKGLPYCSKLINYLENVLIYEKITETKDLLDYGYKLYNLFNKINPKANN